MEKRSGERTMSATRRHGEREIIDISSDEECLRTLKTPSKPLNRITSPWRAQKRRAALPDPKEIIIIDSDDDEPIPTPTPKPNMSGTRMTRRIFTTGSQDQPRHAMPRDAACKSRTIIDLTLTASDSEQLDVDLPKTTSRNPAVPLVRLPGRGMISCKPHSSLRYMPAESGSTRKHLNESVELPTWQILVDTDSDSENDDSVMKSPPARRAPPEDWLSESVGLEPATRPIITVIGKRPPKTPRLTKKAREAAERLRLETYAQNLFRELNKTVFGNGLPENTPLRWNTRLVSTAGRASIRRSKDGSKEIHIELANKILDSEPRIRCTLAHEMCHLACWIIDDNMKENHGALFKKWAKKVMKARPDITITTKHNYNIDYPYVWACVQCNNTYGRFSNSLDVNTVVCGHCRGTLRATFQVRTPRTPRAKAGKRLGEAVAQDDSGTPLAKLLEDLTIDTSTE